MTKTGKINQMIDKFRLNKANPVMQMQLIIFLNIPYIPILEKKIHKKYTKIIRYPNG